MKINNNAQAVSEMVRRRFLFVSHGADLISASITVYAFINRRITIVCCVTRVDFVFGSGIKNVTVVLLKD